MWQTLARATAPTFKLGRPTALRRKNGKSPMWGGGVYELEPQHALGKRLDVSDAGSGDGVNVQIWSANGGGAQRWRLLEQGNDIFELTPLCAPYRRLDVYGAGTTDVVNVQIWQDIDGGAQRWKLLSLSPVSFIDGANVINSNNIIIGFGTNMIDQASVAASDFAITNGSGARLIVTGAQLEPEDGRDRKSTRLN